MKSDKHGEEAWRSNRGWQDMYRAVPTVPYHRDPMAHAVLQREQKKKMVELVVNSMAATTEIGQFVQLCHRGVIDLSQDSKHDGRYVNFRRYDETDVVVSVAAIL
ncbi:hypothetical protein PF006_g7792 [Phytophthora fragariae]|uniref:Uncharacterized protein n=1 Tax=Phytophthora fragariae TaxID=53985 RepID=A0A6A3UC98_9STRA|nr:hypothetical protein PF006_g7792 [Phytophthora fragariae]